MTFAALTVRPVRVMTTLPVKVACLALSSMTRLSALISTACPGVVSALCARAGGAKSMRASARAASADHWAVACGVPGSVSVTPVKVQVFAPPS